MKNLEGSSIHDPHMAMLKVSDRVTWLGELWPGPETSCQRYSDRSLRHGAAVHLSAAVGHWELLAIRDLYFFFF